MKLNRLFVALNLNSVDRVTVRIITPLMFPTKKSDKLPDKPSDKLSNTTLSRCR